jgi:hypothetical protein
MAEIVLQRALHSRPDDPCLQRHLDQIQAAKVSGEGFSHRVVHVPDLQVRAHLAIAWLLLLGLFGLFAGGSYFLVRSSGALSGNTPPASFSELLSVIGVAMAWMGLSALMAHLIFCRVWFVYLSLWPELIVLSVDAAMPLDPVRSPFWSRAYRKSRHAFFSTRYSVPSAPYEGTHGKHSIR